MTLSRLYMLELSADHTVEQIAQMEEAAFCRDSTQQRLRIELWQH